MGERSTLVEYNELKEWLKKDMGLKFDVIVGNPPYQAPNNKAKNVKLWHKFSWAALRMLAPKGWIAFITPASAVSYHGEGGKILEHLQEVLKLEAVEPVSKSAFDVGVDICYWIASTAARGHRVDKSNEELLTDSILQKMLNPKIPRLQLHPHLQPVRREDLVEDEGANKICFSGDKICYTRQEVTNDNELKLVFPFSASYTTQFVSTLPQGMFNMYYKLSSAAEADEIRSFTLSSAYRFFASKYKKTSGFTPAVKSSMLPDMPRGREWTNEEVLGFFKFTDEEIELINRVVAK